MKPISIICSTYNQPRFLSMVLDSLAHQSQKNFELLIADDGSTDETAKLIDQFSKTVDFPVKHVWHEDKGWRKSQLHNRAIKESHGELLIFIDGDCILHPDFVKDHYRVFEKYQTQYVLMGRRVDLGEKITSQLSLANYRSYLLSIFPLKLFCSDSISPMRRYSLKNFLLRKIFRANRVNDLLGCNFSLPRQSMYQINGFNNEYERGEDGDIFVRLRNTGHKLLGMKYYAVMFHLFHGRGNYQYVDDNYHKILKLTDYRQCRDGLTLLS